MLTNNIDQAFPMKSFRDGQRGCIEKAVRAFNDGKDIVIIEAPTGSGKSAIAMTLANMVGTSYYLTITKVLQDQLVSDFEDRIVELKGRNAYPCTYYKRFGKKLVLRKLMTQQAVDKAAADDIGCQKGFCRVGPKLGDEEDERVSRRTKCKD